MVRNSEGLDVVLTRNGEISVVDERGRELESYAVPTGSKLRVADGEQVKEGQILCEWNPYSIPVISAYGGKVRLDDVIEGVTMRYERETSGQNRMVIIEHKGEHHPQITIQDETGHAVDVQYLSERASIKVNDGDVIAPGTVLAENPRETGGVSDITGGLPRVTEICEARKPKDPAVIAEIDGVVEIMNERSRGKRKIIVRSESGIEREHLVPAGKRFLVHTGDYVEAGQALVDGPLVPHDILRVSGEEAVQQYLLHEIQQVYRIQKVEINDKHLEVIIARMLRKVKIESAGDSNLLPGMVMDRFDFRRVNMELAKCVKVMNAGDTGLTEGTIIPKTLLEEKNAEAEQMGGTPGKGKKPKSSTASTQLLGITKAAVQSNSFISAASFQETTKVLTEAALAGKVDKLVGLKENVILGHLIPAGTGFRMFQDAEVSFRREALEALAEAPASLEESFPLLVAGAETPAATAPATKPSRTSEALDSMFGAGQE
jgi:DNA-directed RNA polymerase subunit beta'